jgi:hypothetical protein
MPTLRSPIYSPKLLLITTNSSTYMRFNPSFSLNCRKILHYSRTFSSLYFTRQIFQCIWFSEASWENLESRAAEASTNSLPTMALSSHTRELLPPHAPTAPMVVRDSLHSTSSFLYSALRSDNVCLLCYQVGIAAEHCAT